MNIAETALAAWSETVETPGTEHGPWLITDWEKLRVSSTGTGTLTLEWLMTETDTLTTTTSVVLGTDSIVEVKGKYVKVTSNIGAYTARLWPGNYEGDSGGKVTDDFWNYDTTPGAPTLYNDIAETPGISDIALSPQGPTANSTAMYLSDDGTPGNARAELYTTTNGGQISLSSDGDTDIASHIGDVNIFAGSTSGNLRLQGRDYALISCDNGNIDIEAAGVGAEIRIIPNGPGNISFILSAGGFFTVTGLPIINPGGSGRVWNNGGVLNIT